MKIKTIAFMLFVCIGAIAQKKAKIQGNKVAVDVYNTLAAFSAIEISDDLAVTITQTGSNGYHLKTDENLAGIIKFEVVDAVLKIYSINRITSYKKLEISVTFSEIDEITLIDDVQLTSLNRLQFNTLTLSARDNARFKLDLDAVDGTFILNNNTKGDVLLRGSKANFVLNENAFLEGDIIVDSLAMEVNKRADLNLRGDIQQFNLTATGSADIKAKKLLTKTANIIASNYADIYVHASTELTLYAQGKSNIFVYGNPNIQIEGLNDKSQIVKK